MSVHDLLDDPEFAQASNGRLRRALSLMMEVQSLRRHPLGQPDEGIAYKAANAMALAREAMGGDGDAELPAALADDEFLRAELIALGWTPPCSPPAEANPSGDRIVTEHKDWNAEGARHLALRDKAVAPIGNMQEGAHAYGQRLLANTAFRNAAHEMADTIAGLMAENERLADALGMAQALQRCECAGDEACRAISEANRRAATAEARLRELCEAPTVAVHSSYAVLQWCPGGPLPPIGAELIVRPSVPESGNE